MTGRVISGSRNVFIVRAEDGTDGIYECRIKGKVLKGAEGFYTPLAPGDRAEFTPLPPSPPPLSIAGEIGAGLITGILKRRNLFSRFNTKGNATQPLAANIDAAVCMTASSCPPFRPRFLDRLLLQADAASVRAIIVCNKTDLAASMDSAARARAEARLALFERMGYELLFVSVKTGAGLDALKTLLAGKRAVLAGQSGCGKTSLLNAFFPDAMRKTGLLNRKYGSGSHTTVMSVMFEGGGLALIDTPGLRSFTPDGIRASAVPLLMRDIAPFALECAFGLSCGHGSERGCAVRQALADGRIDADRFESFTRITRELSALRAGRPRGKQ